MGSIRFLLNESWVEENDLAPTTTLLEYLRGTAGLIGTKEGCAEGDCGACTVAVVDPEGGTFRAVNSCLILLPMLHGKRVYTVEGLRRDGEHHPAQEALVEELGSQCGYCTPGVIMSMFAACYRRDLDAAWKFDDQMCGNLCRCTGYRPIRAALESVAGACPDDDFARALEAPTPAVPELAYGPPSARFYAPRSFDALWALMSQHSDIRFVCGATDLGLDVTKRHARYACLVSLESIPELRQLAPGPDVWRVGATVTLAELEAATEDALPAITRMLRYFGARQIKNRATLGGNLCNASPIGDMPPVLLALGATVIVRSASGERKIPISEFFLAYRETALAPGEILTAVEVPVPPADARIATYKVSKRRELDISAVCAGFYVRVGDDGLISEARIAYGGMAATPKRASAVEAALVGASFSEATFEAAAGAIHLDFAPIDDHRGSAWYRKTVAENFVRGFFLEARRPGTVSLSERPVGTVVLEAGP